MQAGSRVEAVWAGGEWMGAAAHPALRLTRLLFRRADHSDLAAHTGGLPATIYAMKNPTPAIRYAAAVNAFPSPSAGGRSGRAGQWSCVDGQRSSSSLLSAAPAPRML